MSATEFQQKMSELNHAWKGYYHQRLINEMQEEIGKCVAKGDWGPAEAMRKGVEAIQFLEIEIWDMMEEK